MFSSVLAELPLLGFLLSAVLALTMMGLAWGFKAAVDRLPAAARNQNVEMDLARNQHLLAGKLADIERAEQELRELQGRIQDRDRIGADVAALKSQLDDLRLELAGLDDARKEIAATKLEAADAAAELAEKKSALEALRIEAEQLGRVREELEKLLAERDRLKTSLDELEQERDTLRSTLPELRAERDAALRLIEEYRLLEMRHARLQDEIARLERDLAEADARRHELAEVERQIAIQADSLRREAAELQHMRDEHTGLVAAVAALETTRDALRDELSRFGGGQGKAPPVDEKELIRDLELEPAALASPVLLSNVIAVDETEAVEHVARQLRREGLAYHDRQLYAFHTALKINDNAQLTVLAGVSGTGKSLLPRRYAEAMGIHFLQIPVEPRWDSPQDLLGFYNYIEGKYRATDLARLLRHMDPESGYKRDHMAIVLMDEMNLARVEYYFSEFLSRLEVRPPFDATSEAARNSARIAIDIRGLETPLQLYPGHNVLFVGTMNDDESTQSLSDKVLDRANVMQFAAPRRFNSAQGDRSAPAAEGALRLRTWRGWVRKPDQLERAQREKAGRVIGSLAEIMEKCGRPFGHRLNESILSYCANYPRFAGRASNADIEIPLVDQIELRILPKLRGLDLNSYLDALEELGSLLQNDLDDGDLAERLRELVAQQETAGQFNWRGFNRAVE